MARRTRSKALRRATVGKYSNLRRKPALDLLARLERPEAGLRALTAPGAGPEPPPERAITDRFNAAVGCKTDEVALALLAQLASIEPVNWEDCSDEDVDRILMKTTAMLAELEPKTGAEAMTGALMVGAQRAAMQFLTRSLQSGQTHIAIDLNVNRAAKLMRLFSEHAQTMTKLKGKSGQQRVVVEHVNVHPGGQAIVGTVIPRGASGGDSGEPR